MRIRNWLLSIIKAIRIRPDRRKRRWQNKLRSLGRCPVCRMLAATTLTPLLVANINGDEPLFPGFEKQVGVRPNCVTTGDSNGDGVTDVATSSGLSDNVSLLLGVGGGIFAAEITYSAGDNPTCVTTGDFNGDGVTDLVTANPGSDNVSVFLGVGDGTFTAQTTHATAGDGPFFLTTEDFNGDVFTDLATANLDSDNVSVLLNQSSSDFLIEDLNQDEVISLLDVTPFMALLVSGEFQTEADINQNSEVDLLDIALFVDLLTDG